MLAAYGIQGFLAVANGTDGIAISFEVKARQLNDIGFVIHDQNLLLFHQIGLLLSLGQEGHGFNFHCCAFGQRTNLEG